MVNGGQYLAQMLPFYPTLPLNKRLSRRRPRVRLLLLLLPKSLKAGLLAAFLCVCAEFVPKKTWAGAGFQLDFNGNQQTYPIILMLEKCVVERIALFPGKGGS